MRYSFEAVSQPFTMLEICFSGVYDREIVDSYGLAGQPFFTDALDFEYDFELPAQYIWRNFWTFDKEALLECSYKICEVLLKLYEFSKIKENGQRAEINELTPALDIIKLYYMRDLSVTDLADAIGMQTSDFTAKFKKIYKTTPKKYLTRYRLSQAAYMLRNYPSALISEIAENCGFSNPSYFCSVFKRFYGITPEEYRIAAPTRAQRFRSKKRPDLRI